MAHNSNWIKLYRQIFDSQIWNVKEPFDIRSAWIDLILMANHKEGNVFISGELITVPRGAHFTSIQNLGARWKWSIKRVRAYLKVLEKAEMVTVKGTHRGTLITIVKYDDYQGRGQTEGTTQGTPEGTSEGISEGISEGTQTRNKEIENDKEGEEAPHLGGWVLDEQGRYEWDDTARSSYDFSNDSRQLDIPQSTPRSRVEQLRNLLRGISTLPGAGSPTGDSECDS